MEKIKWGIIGTGRIANEFASDFDFVKNGELYGVASRAIESANEFARKHGSIKAYGSYDALYADPEIDAVYIATPNNSHRENTLLALDSGKAVLCEKPITINQEELVEVRKKVMKTGAYLMEGMWTYFLPAIQKALEWVDSGAIGRVRHIKANFGFAAPFDPKGRLFNPELAGGSMLDVGIYPIALSWLFLKKDPIDVHVHVSKAETGVDDDVVYFLDYGDSFASLHCSIKYQLHNHAFIIGDKGYIQLPDFWRASECLLFKGNELENHYHDSRKSKGYNYEIESMNEDLIKGRNMSGVMPLEYSQKLQDQMAMVMKYF